MKIQDLRIGMEVRHPQYGTGHVKKIEVKTVEILFPDGGRTLDPEACGLQPLQAQVEVSGLDVPLKDFIQSVVSQTIRDLGLEKPEQDPIIEQLGTKWNGGKMELKPADPSLQGKEIPLEVFFHKIVMVRDNLRVLEQKINSSKILSEGEKVEWQQYISRIYGSLTTFNILFREKNQQFNSKAV